MLDFNNLPLRTTKEVILEQIDARDKDILDVGCGTGKTTKLLTRLGGRLIGLECGEAPLLSARSKSKIAQEEFIEGVGQNLPFDDQSFDHICFFFSLHHVPIPEQETALEEAHRVLRSQGSVYIFEPIAQGSSFTVMQPVDDETIVRAAAQEAINTTKDQGLFSCLEDFKYRELYTYADFDDFKQKAIMVDAARSESLKTCETLVQSLFHEQSVKVKEGFQFEEAVHFIRFQKN